MIVRTVQYGHRHGSDIAGLPLLLQSGVSRCSREDLVVTTTMDTMRRILIVGRVDVILTVINPIRTE